MTLSIDWIWLLLALPLAFGLGWFFSRLDIWQWKLEARHAPRAYFKALNHLLSGQQDRAIDGFIEAIQNDPDTSELHFTLGNLFRRRGEYDRAVRVHEHLLARADLSSSERARAQFALAQDYAKAGLLDRAELALASCAHDRESLQLLLSIYERGRDWVKAHQTAQQLQALGAANYNKRCAHYLCEQGLFEQAMAVAPQAPRAFLERANQYIEQNDLAAAHLLLMQAAQQAPQAMPLLAAALWRTSQTQAQKQAVRQTLVQAYENMHSLDILEVLIEAGWMDAHSAYAMHLSQHASLVAARHLIDLPQVQQALQKATEPLQRYRCAACGFEAKQYFWQCPGCQAWDSYPFKRVEEL